MKFKYGYIIEQVFSVRSVELEAIIWGWISRDRQDVAVRKKEREN